jgi:DUF1680 family protein
MEHYQKKGTYRKLIFLFIGLLTVSYYGCNNSKSSTKTEYEPLIPVYFQTIEVDGFWKKQMKKLVEEWLPHCIEQMEEGGRGEELMNLVYTSKALQDQEHGEYTGRVFSDAYVYNVIEAICLALTIDPGEDEDLEKAQHFLQNKMNEWIPIIESAQCKDGYIHSYHILTKQERYSDFRAHEFYVMGYLIEMGVAHFQLTGGKDTRLFNVAQKCAEHLISTFGQEHNRNWVYGHSGMGIALCRFARLVNQTEGNEDGDKYFELAKYFFDNRHTNDGVHDKYNQTHLPVVEMDEAVGHAVRATYFYSGIADLAMLTSDNQYLAAVNKIWDNAIHCKSYITGGVGASHTGEAFSDNYDLSNNGYCETCAGCGLTFWATRMHQIHHDAHYIDVQERALFNNILGAIDDGGENFFYQNPLISNETRDPWHRVPCCVGNFPRSLIAIKDLMYSLNATKDVLYVNHYVESRGTIPNVAGAALTIEQKTEYPWKGDVAMILSPEKSKNFTVKLRIPDRKESDLYSVQPELNSKYSLMINSEDISLPIEKGYITIKRKWKKGDKIELLFPLEIQRVYCSDKVSENVGHVALQRGPLIYNIEDVDNDNDVKEMLLKPETNLESVWDPDLFEGAMIIKGDGITAIPNYLRLNRGGWSSVWIKEDPKLIMVLDEKQVERNLILGEIEKLESQIDYDEYHLDNNLLSIASDKEAARTRIFDNKMRMKELKKQLK